MKQLKPSTNIEPQAPQPVSFAFENNSVPVLKRLVDWLARSYLALILLTMLVLILYWVFFMLPGSVTEPKTTAAPESLVKTTVKPIKESPWQDAQLAKHRRESQQILAKVLEKQKFLEDKQVEQWAAAEFDSAIKAAESGDLLYRTQEFAKAMASYHLALEQLTAIEDQVPAIFSAYLEQGLASLTAQNSQRAKAQLTIALYLKPNDPDAATAFDRAIVLDQVMQLAKDGEVLLDEQQLEAAKAKFSQALTLDKHSELTKSLLARVNQSIKQRDYAITMSDGYNAINRGQYQQAIRHFTKAQQISPDAQDPRRAIEQSKNLQTKSAIRLGMSQAQAFENTEQWSQANIKYRQLLQQDKSLMAARVGHLRTLARQRLDQQLSEIIANPIRLANDKVYRQAQQVYHNALKTKQPGKKLSQQLAQVKRALAEAVVPVALRIESDNHTQITLYRVAELGNFVSKELSLKPGEYTAVGSRDGYQDVRQQFTLLPNSQLKTIIIQCNDKVSNG